MKPSHGVFCYSMIALKSLFVFCSTSVLAADMLPPKKEAPIDIQEKWYASEFGVSLDEAKKRQSVINHANKLAVYLEKDSDFVDMYIEHVPKFKVVFSYVRNSGLQYQTELKKLISNSSLEKYATIKLVEYSSGDLEKIQKDVLSSLSSYGVEKYQMYIDPKINRVVVQVLPEERTQAEVGLNQFAITNLSKNLKSRSEDNINLSNGVIIEDLKEVPKFISWGGGLLRNYSDTAWCTSGFSVRNAQGVLGLTSAEHCSTINYWYNASSKNKLSLKSASASRDVAWFSTPSTVSPPINKIEVAQDNYGNATEFRTITGIQAVKVGNSVCKFGKTTGRTCGIVVSVNTTINTGTIQQPHLVYNLVMVTKNGQANGGSITHTGDSGGPWFISSNAVGTSVAGDLYSPASYFAPVASITSMGVSILTK